MNDRDVGALIDEDLQRAPRVMYLEGPNDPPVLAALLGTEFDRVDVGVFYDPARRVLIRRLDGRGSVERRLRVAAGRPGVYGVCDGDGRSFSTLAAGFDAPAKGPLFRWKGYSIENLLCRVGWPAPWGRSPRWRDVVRRFATYAALNRLHLHVRGLLEKLQLAEFQSPAMDCSLSSKEVLARLREQAHLLPKADVVAFFRDELRVLHAADEDEQHARINGKWIVDVYAPEHLRRPADVCRREWIEDARGRNGHLEVRAWWNRLFP